MATPVFVVFCILSVAVFGVVAGPQRWSSALFAISFLTAAIAPIQRIDSEAIAIAVAVLAAACLWRPGLGHLAAGLAGAIAAGWIHAMSIAGSAFLVMLLIAGAAAAAGITLAKRPGFAPARMREEALLLLLGGGLLLALAPTIADGYLTALKLKSMPVEAPRASGLPLALAVLVGSLVLGALSTLRRPT